MMGIGPGIGMDMGMGIGMGNMEGMLNSGYNNGNQSTGYQRFNQQPQNESESPYQRLPVNPRRRAQKRDRPEDFLEMDGTQKIPRYYE